MSDREMRPLSEEQTAAFAQKLNQFRETLEPHEQAALDVMVLRVAHQPAQDPDVRGYDDGGPDMNPNIDRFTGDDYNPAYPPRAVVVPGYNYYVPYAVPFARPLTLTQIYRIQHGVW